MNTEINNTKRKKRRTRKYFNEIRKRLRREDSRYLVRDPACDSNKVQHSNRNNNNKITHNRLTLPILPKVVRSETITRPILVEIKHKYDFNDLVKARNSSTVNTNNTSYMFQTKSDEQQNNSDTLQEAKEMVHNEKIIEDDEIPFGNFILVSPIYRDRKVDESISNESPIRPFLPKLSAQNSELHENFMKRLSHLLRKKYPEKCFTYNPAKYFRAQIDKINNKILESQITRVTSIEKDNSTRNKIVQNPVDHIRLAQTTPDAIIDSHNSSSRSSDSQPHLHSPLLLKDTCIIQDTPEYNYYPHKLHQ